MTYTGNQANHNSRLKLIRYFVLDCSKCISKPSYINILKALHYQQDLRKFNNYALVAPNKICI